ncbi:MAG: CYTH domain-containing protein [Desulfovibrio sp.]|jgi:CYTH domain-containing protein|nr:CYTH domain-containing protein [Desulfovibrio sp.]
MKIVANCKAGPPEFTEIERKFLPARDGWRALPATRLHIRQGYLNLDPERTVRVRLCEEIRGTAPSADLSGPLPGKTENGPAGQAFLTVKGKRRGAAAAEFDFPIPAREAAVLLETLALRPFVEKIRHRVELPPHVWEIDEFIGGNLGLIIIEVELDNENTPLLLPDWVGPEVTGDPRYANASLVREPFGRRQA